LGNEAVGVNMEVDYRFTYFPATNVRNNEQQSKWLLLTYPS